MPPTQAQEAQAARLGVFRNVSQTIGSLKIPPQDSPKMPGASTPAGPAKGKPRK